MLQPKSSSVNTMTYPTIASIYTDGACLGNPGPGGWGLVVNFTDGSVAEWGGSEAATTNNRMEMAAAIAALKIVAASQQRQPLTLYTDSEYVLKGITQWIFGWKKRNWKTAKGDPVLNQDLWQTLDQLNAASVNWHHVRGHSGDRDNERCDTIARGFAQQAPPSFRHPLPSHLAIAFNQNSATKVTGLSDSNPQKTVRYKEKQQSILTSPTTTMTNNSVVQPAEDLQLPREVRVNQLRNLIESLRIADEIASKGYLISSSELADLMDVNASAVTSRGDHWPWRNWVVSRVRREGNQILWQLERVD
jgi:ribonuclease HI